MASRLSSSNFRDETNRENGAQHAYPIARQAVRGGTAKGVHLLREDIEPYADDLDAQLCALMGVSTLFCAKASSITGRAGSSMSEPDALAAVDEAAA